MAPLGGSTFAVIDGKDLGPYSVGNDGIMFSPDSRHAAYIVSTESTERVVVDGVEGLVAQIIIGAGGNRVVFDSGDSLHYLAVLRDAEPPGFYLIQEKIK